MGSRTMHISCSLQLACSHRFPLRKRFFQGPKTGRIVITPFSSVPIHTDNLITQVLTLDQPILNLI